ncbi:MAG: hypothetical protein AAF841_04880 [Pseudomonadota bacterium]
MSWAYYGAGALGLLALAILGQIIRCWFKDPKRALALTTHDPALFPQVMAGRYIFLAYILALALLSGSVLAIAAVFAGFSFLGFFDAVLYARAGKPARKHWQAGVGSALAAALSVSFWAIAA